MIQKLKLVFFMAFKYFEAYILTMYMYLGMYTLPIKLKYPTYNIAQQLHGIYFIPIFSFKSYDPLWPCTPQVWVDFQFTFLIFFVHFSPIWSYLADSSRPHRHQHMPPSISMWISVLRSFFSDLPEFLLPPIANFASTSNSPSLSGSRRSE